MNASVFVRRKMVAAVTTLSVLCGPALRIANAAEVPDGSVYPAPITDRLQRLSEPELKGLYRRCSHAALHGLLGGVEMALCSTASEILLKRIFLGDFDALLAWSRLQPDEAVHDDADGRRVAGNPHPLR